MVSRHHAVILRKQINSASDPTSLSTATDSVVADKIADFSVDQLGEVVTSYVLPSTPTVLSVGKGI